MFKNTFIETMLVIITLLFLSQWWFIARKGTIESWSEFLDMIYFLVLGSVSLIITIKKIVIGLRA